MSCQPDAQPMVGAAIDAIGEQDASVPPIVGISPLQLGKAEEGTGLQQSRGNHQIIAGM